MATYNGEEFLRVQLDSILAQLGPDDELLVQDDGSSDETLNIIDSYHDDRIEVVRNETNLGVIGTFERCLARARHEIVFLSDQDDEWLPGKVDAVVAAFADPHVTGVVTNALIVDRDGATTSDSYFAHARSGPGVVHNFVKNSYLGCCLAVRRDVIPVATPVPRSVRTHDGWIGITADLMGTVVFLPTPYLRYRRHGGNISMALDESDARTRAEVLEPFLRGFEERGEPLPPSTKALAATEAQAQAEAEQQARADAERRRREEWESLSWAGRTRRRVGRRVRRVRTRVAAWIAP